MQEQITAAKNVNSQFFHILNEEREDLLMLNEQDTKFIKDFGSMKIQACARTVSIQNWHDLAMADFQKTGQKRELSVEGEQSGKKRSKLSIEIQ